MTTNGAPNPGRDRTSRGPLILSLALNLTLAAAALAVWQHRPPPSPGAARATSTPPAHLAAPAPEIINAPAAPKVIPFHWRMVEADDYRQYIANLRAIECPERLIRDLIVADVEKLYGQREADLEPARIEPWYNATRRRAAQRAATTREEALHAEQRTVIKELLGYEWSSGAAKIWNEEPIAAVLLGFLSDEKGVRVVQLIEGVEKESRRIRDAADHILLDADRAQLRQLFGRVTGELPILLSLAEGDELRRRIQVIKFAMNDEKFEGVNLTGAELRQITGLSLKVSDVLEDLVLRDGEDPSEAEQKRRQQAFEKDLAQLLVPARFADYQRAQDGAFHAAFQFARAHDLPTAAAVKVYETRRSAEREADLIASDASLSAEQQAIALQAIQQTAAQTIAGSLGAAGHEYLTNNTAWFQGLTSRTNQPPAEAGP
jgi:hypothetical protein